MIKVAPDTATRYVPPTATDHHDTAALQSYDLILAFMCNTQYSTVLYCGLLRKFYT